MILSSLTDEKSGVLSTSPSTGKQGMTSHGLGRTPLGPALPGTRESHVPKEGGHQPPLTKH